MRVRSSSVVGALVLLAALVLGAPAGTLAAQATPEPSGDVSPMYSPADLPGLQQAAARSYAADMAALFATREAAATAAATPDYAAMGVVTLNAVMLQFDSGEHAASAFETVVKQMTSPASTGGIQLEGVAVEGFSGPAKVYTASIDQGPGLTLHQAVLMTQDGPFVYQTIAVALSSSEDAQATAADVAKAMIAAPVGEGEGTFAEDGTSTGGVWDKFPAAGDPVLRGMTPEIDNRLYPST